MNRYFQSFLIAAFIYSSLFGAMFFSSGMEKKSVQAKKVQKINMQAYQSAAPKQPPKKTKPAPKPEPKPEPKPTPKPQPKEKPKKTEKKTVQKKPAKQPKKEHKKPDKKPKPQKKAPVKKETKPKPGQLQTAKAINQNMQTFDQIKKNLLQKRTQRYLNALKQQLQKYKQYPRVAQRRGWQDEVKLTFSINNYDEIVIKAAKSRRGIFAKYGKKALKQAFKSMQDTPHDLRFPINANIALRYKLN